MLKIKNFKEFVNEVNTNPDLQEKLKANPVEVLKGYTIEPPIYTSDKLVYRVVVLGFVGSLLLGILFFIYQYQHSLNVRAAYSTSILNALKEINTTSISPQQDSIVIKKIETLKSILTNSSGLSATTPDGIISVLTGIIGVLAGLFAASPLGKRES